MILPTTLWENSIETTARPEEVSDVSDGHPEPVIHSSKEYVEEVKFNNDEDDEQMEEGRFGYFGLKNKFKKKIKFITLVTTTAVTRTSTSTSYITISTKTFFIQICTPSPFPFNVCHVARKKREIEFEPKYFDAAEMSSTQSRIENRA